MTCAAAWDTLFLGFAHAVARYIYSAFSESAVFDKAD